MTLPSVSHDAPGAGQPPAGAPPPPATSSAAAQRGVDWAAWLAKLGPLIGLVFVVILFSALRYDTFFTVYNFELILRQTAVVGVAALGMTLIIIAGGIDLSVGSAIAVVTVTIALLLPHKAERLVDGNIVRYVTGGVAPWLAVLGGVAAGTLVGLVNGTLITRLKLLPFIITLGMMSILRGVATGLAKKEMVYPGVPGAPNARPKLGLLGNLLQPIDNERLWLLTPGVWLMLALALLVAAMLRYTRFGRYIFAVGSNEQTARLCGVPVERTKLLIYVCGAALTALAGVLQFSNLVMGDPTTAIGLELDIIAAVVIGGASLAGGQGTVLGSLVGALIMTVVANGCSKLGLENWVQQIVTGVIIVLAVALDRLRHRKSAASE
jgi:ribose/xylose/arabinose/galactoside ABC-type transport system permease subunit